MSKTLEDYPTLKKEWYHEKNNHLFEENLFGFKFSDISYGSSKVVWWKCKNNHEWQQSVVRRTELKNKVCHICKKLNIL